MKRYHFDPPGLPPSKREAITNIDADAEELYSSHMGAFIKLCSHFEEQFGVSLPSQTWLLYDPATPLLGIIQEN